MVFALVVFGFSGRSVLAKGKHLLTINILYQKQKVLVIQIAYFRLIKGVFTCEERSIFYVLKKTPVWGLNCS
jgi:hypothetical protein